jgi:hypothetical protein
MVELAECHFSAQTNCEREQQELTRLAEVEGFIQKRAAQFSMGDPMLAEDLAQEARERALSGHQLERLAWMSSITQFLPAIDQWIAASRRLVTLSFSNIL